MSLTLTLASRNLLHDRLRFIATLVGIVFSVVLVMIQMGLFLGFGHMVSTMIDHASTPGFTSMNPRVLVAPSNSATEPTK